MKPDSVGAELGTFKGGFIDYLLKSKPKLLYLVDPWYRATPEWKWAQGNQSTTLALVCILEEFQEEIASGLIQPRVEFSQEFLMAIPDQSLDWAYIDSTHTYDQTLLELSLCVSKVKKDGLIMGDDFSLHPGARHKGVSEAVYEMVRIKKIELLVDGREQQFVAKIV
jgi:hypothetical protein